MDIRQRLINRLTEFRDTVAGVVAQAIDEGLPYAPLPLLAELTEEIAWLGKASIIDGVTGVDYATRNLAREFK